jgi:hypothetical protein
MSGSPFDVMSQEAIIVAMVDSRTTKKTSDPTAILNSVCREGLGVADRLIRLRRGGVTSRDKFMSSRYYLFKRCEANAEPARQSVGARGQTIEHGADP